MSKFDAMKYGPLGDAVAAAVPHSEADPVGIYAATLSLFSAALNGKVMMDNGRPVVVWTVLAGKSALGRKGYALRTARKIVDPSIGGFISARMHSGISSGPSLVNMLWQHEMETAGTESGMDGRALIVEEEWASVLKLSKRDATFSQKLRTTWDGALVSNTTKAGTQEVITPLLGFHAHITPGEWAVHVSKADALGGSFNRLLPVTVEKSKMLPYNHVAKFEENQALTAAYRWAAEDTRFISFTADAGRRYDELRAEIEDRMAEMPEHLSCYMERSAEQVVRVAAVLTAAEKKTRISKGALEAAWAFVSYSMASVERLVMDAASPSGKVTKSLPDLIREILEKYAGEASSTLMLRSLGSRVTAASLKATVAEMHDVDVYKAESSGRGAKPIMYRLTKGEQAEAPPEVEAEPAPQPKPKRARKTTAPKNKPETPRLAVVTSGTRPAARRRPAKKATTVTPSGPLDHLLIL